MDKPTPQNITDTLLSPKQAQQRQIRTIALQKIDSQIQNILSLNMQQQSQYKDFSKQLTIIQQLYQRQNRELREEVQNLKEKCIELQKLYLATKDDLLANVALLQELTQQKMKKEREVMKLKNMVKNQECLIDQYKKNIVEEIALEQELMKATLDEEKGKFEREFNHALLQMEQKYQEKMKRLIKEIKLKECQGELHEFRKYLHSNKENHHEKIMKKSPSYARKIASQYSTNDHQSKVSDVNRHNQPIFLQ